MLARVDIAETDEGPRAGRSGVERLCAVTRTVRPVDQLIRFVAAPDGTIVADLKRRLPGRGVWITATRTTVDEASRRNVFARSLKREVRAGADLAATVERQLEQAALDALAIVHKAGRLAIGFAKTEAALANAPVVAILSATDGAADGARKIAAAAARRQAAENKEQIRTIVSFTTAQLDLALGRSNVVHAALLAGPASEGFLARCDSLERFRTASPDGRGHPPRERV